MAWRGAREEIDKRGRGWSAHGGRLIDSVRLRGRSGRGCTVVRGIGTPDPVPSFRPPQPLTRPAPAGGPKTQPGAPPARPPAATGAPPARPMATAAKPPPNNGKPVSSETFASKLMPIQGHSNSMCHLNITGMTQVRVECLLEVKCAQVTAEHYLLYVPVPPLTSFQGEGKVTIALPAPSTVPPQCKATCDSQGRELVQVLIPTQQHPHLKNRLLVVASLEASLFTRELFFDPNVQLPYVVASEQELVNATQGDSVPYTLDDQVFQKFVRENGSHLFRKESEVGEECIIYAQRVYQFVSENFNFANNAEGNLTTIIQSKKANSAGLALLYCALLRCQEVPARVVFGRLMEGDMPPHALTEFFVEEIGWIPADIVTMVRRGMNMPKKADGKMPFFGEQGPTFLALHYDSRLDLDTIKSGMKVVDTLLSPQYWVSGQGDLRTVASRSAWKIVQQSPVSL